MTLGPGEAGQPAAVKASGITKRFGPRLVLKGINLEVAPGERVAIFGPNGAGKSTLLRILATVASPTTGTVEVGGVDPEEEPLEARRRIGVISHHPYLYDDLTARENLRYYARMYDVPDRDARVRELAAKVGLSARLDDRVGTFSHGMQQRLAMARAVLHDPDVLMLDEPEGGLDQEGLDLLVRLLGDRTPPPAPPPQGEGSEVSEGRRRAAVVVEPTAAVPWGEVGEVSEGRRRAAVVVTHHLDLGLALSDRVAILVGGRIAFQSPSSELDAAMVRELYSRHTAQPRTTWRGAPSAGEQGSRGDAETRAGVA